MYRSSAKNVRSKSLDGHTNNFEQDIDENSKLGNCNSQEISSARASSARGTGADTFYMCDLHHDQQYYVFFTLSFF